MTVGELWQLAICTPLASSVVAGELCTVGKLCGSWQAVWQLAICTPLASCITLVAENAESGLGTYRFQLCSSMTISAQQCDLHHATAMLRTKYDDSKAKVDEAVKKTRLKTVKRRRINAFLPIPIPSTVDLSVALAEFAFRVTIPKV